MVVANFWYVHLFIAQTLAFLWRQIRLEALCVELVR
jgi:hypothetical protein